MKSSDWDKLFTLIPNYDVWRDAGDCTFDMKRAERVVGFIENLCKQTSAEWLGKPFILQDWQKAILGALFGFIRGNGIRRYRKAYVSVARKNGKSTLAAAIGLYLLLADGEPAPQVFSAAGKRDQAREIFDAAKKMVAQEPEFIKRTRVLQHSITTADRFGMYRVLAADGKLNFGLNVHGLLIDELWVLKGQKGQDLWSALTTGSGARRQPLHLAFTTAGDDKEGLCYREQTKAQAVINGSSRDDSLLPVIYQVPDEADWTDDSLLTLSNPSLQAIPTLKPDILRLKQDALTYKGDEIRYRTWHLNQWVSQGENRIVNMMDWDQCPNRCDLNSLVGLPCFGGFDLGLGESHTCFALFFPTVKTVLVWAWIPRDDLKTRINRDNFDYNQYIGADNEIDHNRYWVQLMPGNVIHYEFLEDRVREIMNKYSPVSVAVDRAMLLPIGRHLMYEFGNLKAMGQGYISLTYPCREFEKLVTGHELNHVGNPLLRWSVDHSELKVDLNASMDSCKVKRPNSGSRIDACLSAIMAIGQASIDYEDSDAGVWFITPDN